jgi:transcriptional regulator
MYIPPAFEETSVAVMHELMRAHPFAAIVMAGSDGLVATHIPLVLHAEAGEYGTLRGHIARANPQWADSSAGADALVIFSGPHHYVSPSWYPTKRQDARVVPTWNYTVVHAYGPLVAHPEPAWLLEHLHSLVTQQESRFDLRWELVDAPADYIERQMRAIVGIEIPIRRLEGKWKLSQNRSESDREGVLQGLDEVSSGDALALRGLMSERR